MTSEDIRRFPRWQLPIIARMLEERIKCNIAEHDRTVAAGSPKGRYMDAVEQYRKEVVMVQAAIGEGQ